MTGIKTEYGSNLPRLQQTVNGSATLDKDGNRVPRREWLIALSIALVAVIIMQIPYALGYLTAPPGTEYTGLLLNVEDYSYYAIMLQGYNGAWEYHIQFTTEPHSPEFLYGFYLGLGHLARALNVPIAVVWHGARVAAALLLFLTLFGFLGLFLRRASHRMFAYLLAIFGSGFDWVLFPFEQFNIVGGAPVDFRMPEAHLFYTALTYPHISFGIALLLVEFWLWLRLLRLGRLRYVFFLGVVNFAIGIVYPFLIYLVAAILGTHWIYRVLRTKRILWRELGYLVVAGMFVLPLFAYYEYVLWTNPVFRIWDAQAVTQSPIPLHYILAYGVMLVLSFPVFRASFLVSADVNSAREPASRNNLVFLWIWVIIAAFLLYAPLNAQRRFLQGLQVPLAILATIGFFIAILPRIERTQVFRALLRRPNYSARGLRRLIIVFFLAVMSTANVIVLLRLSMFTAIEHSDALFRPLTEVQAIDWLHAHTTAMDAVLAAYWTGSFIPARAGNTVFLGQRYETSHFADKMILLDKFFNVKTTDVWRESLLTQYHIAYVFYGPRECALGGLPKDVSYLQPVFSNEAVRIYRVSIP